MSAAKSPLHVGYACEWWRPRAPTWSYTADRLRSGLQRQTRVSALDAQRSLPGAAALTALFAPARGLPWKYSGLNRRLVDRAIRRGAARAGVDAVIEVADLDTPTRVPTFCYQDMNYSVALAHRDDVGAGLITTLPASRGVLERRSEAQRVRYRALTGVFAMSEWFARWLVERQGVDAARVHVVGSGLNQLPARSRDPNRAPTRLLFVGGEFVRKGGDLAVAAVDQLRRRGWGALQLTVVGPPRWPLTSPPPSWVDFRGRLSGDAVAELYADHDVFVLPSRFEAYGIAALEAQAAGLPVVAHRAYALPELVVDGKGGVLIDDLRPDTIAEAIARTLDDGALFESVAAAAPDIRRRHSWDVVARRMLEVIADAVAEHRGQDRTEGDAEPWNPEPSLEA